MFWAAVGIAAGGGEGVGLGTHMGIAATVGDGAGVGTVSTTKVRTGDGIGVERLTTLVAAIVGRATGVDSGLGCTTGRITGVGLGPGMGLTGDGSVRAEDTCVGDAAGAPMGSAWASGAAPTANREKPGVVARNGLFDAARRSLPPEYSVGNGVQSSRNRYRTTSSRATS